MSILAINDRVLVRLEDEGKTTASGLTLVSLNPDERRPRWARVLHVSESFIEGGIGIPRDEEGGYGSWFDMGKHIDWGRRVLLDPYHGGVPVPGRPELLLVKLRDIVAIDDEEDES